MLDDAIKLLRHALVEDPRRWDPLLAVYYLTYACELWCPYCSDGAGRPYWTLPPRSFFRVEGLRRPRRAAR